MAENNEFSGLYNKTFEAKKTQLSLDPLRKQLATERQLRKKAIEDNYELQRLHELLESKKISQKDFEYQSIKLRKATSEKLLKISEEEARDERKLREDAYTASMQVLLQNYKTQNEKKKLAYQQAASETDSQKRAAIRRQLTREINKLEEEAQVIRNSEKEHEIFAENARKKARQVYIANLQSIDHELAVKEKIADNEAERKKLIEEQVQLMADEEQLSSQIAALDQKKASGGKLKKQEEKQYAALVSALKANEGALQQNKQSLDGLDSELNGTGGLLIEQVKAQIEKQDQSVKSDATKRVGETMKKAADARHEREVRHAYANSEEHKGAEKERFGEEFKNNAEEAAVKNSLENLGAALNDATNQIDNDIDSFYEYQATVEARLQGSEHNYQDALKTISKNVGISGIVSQKEVIQNLKKASDTGIAYNLELRAFLATISEDIANTFDAFDSNLMRLIRLQQSDTTAARLGMEASLTKLFNSYFSDTSYLTDAYDQVSQAIIEANAQLTKDMSIQFEHTVQKWLGSLYSVGMDSGTIQTIAQGLNYLGTGNVEALNGNDSLNSLLAMSASRAGISYADILTGGLDAKTTNDLLKSMVEYLQSIANNTDNNQVTKSAYSNVFGFNMADLTAVSSLSSTDISNLYNTVAMDYESSIQEYSNQAGQILSRTHISQILDTAFENALATSATAIGNNAGLYTTWKVLNVIEDLTGGIAIPAVEVYGFMVDLHQTVTGLAKAGIAGLGLMGGLLGSMANLSLFGTNDLNSWGYDEFTSRGSASKGISSGTASGTSQSSSLGTKMSASGDDVKGTSMSDGADQAEEDSKTTNKNQEDAGDIYQDIYAAIAEEGGATVLTEIKQLNITALAYQDYFNTIIELMKTNTFKTEMAGMSGITESLDPQRIFFTANVANMSSTIDSFETNNSGVILYKGFNATAENYATLHAAQNMSSVNNEIATLISTRSAENKVLNEAINNASSSNSSNSSSSNNAVSVAVASMTSDAQKVFTEVFKTALVSAFSATEEGTSILEGLKDAINGVEVKINNDNFEEFLQANSNR